MASEWTVDTLKEYFERVIRDQGTATDAALMAANKATDAALMSADKAVNLAADGLREWRAGANEWRGAMTDRERSFISRAEFDQMNKSTKELLDRLQVNMDIGTGNKQGRAEAWAFLAMAAGAVGAVLGFLIG